MTQFLTIGTMSKKVGLPTKTIRYYEDIGLISEPKRAENGYRVYPEKAIEELSVIKSARDLGLPIPEIKRLMVGCEQGDCEHTKAYVEKEVSDYLSVLGKKIEQLQILQTRLSDFRRTIQMDTHDGNDIYCCNILKQITQIPKGGDKK